MGRNLQMRAAVLAHEAMYVKAVDDADASSRPPSSSTSASAEASAADDAAASSAPFPHRRSAAKVVTPGVLLNYYVQRVVYGLQVGLHTCGLPVARGTPPAIPGTLSPHSNFAPRTAGGAAVLEHMALVYESMNNGWRLSQFRPSPKNNQHQEEATQPRSGNSHQKEEPHTTPEGESDRDRRRRITMASSVDYVTSWMLSGDHHRLIPALVPVVDRIDHGPVSNLAVDVVEKTVAEHGGGGVRGERGKRSGQPQPPSEGAGGSMHHDDVRSREERKNAIPTTVGGMDGIFKVTSDGRFLEVRTTDDVATGEPLVLSYVSSTTAANSDQQSRAFGLYRFGFVPVM